MTANRWGLIPDVPNGKDWDIRDHVQFSPITAPIVDLRVFYKKYQRQYGSCTGFWAERIMRTTLKKNNQPDIELSPLFAYYNNRLKSGLPVTQDTGAGMRATVDALREFGICRESYWTYKNVDGYIFVKPEPYAYEDALEHQALESYSIPNNLDIIRQTIASGYAVGLGVAVHRMAFEFAPKGNVTMPNANDFLAGAHAILLDRMDDNVGRFGFPNYWERWGDDGQGGDGYGTLPYEFPARYGFDLWAIKKVESPNPAPTNNVASVEFNNGQVSRMEGVKVITVNNRQVFP